MTIPQFLTLLRKSAAAWNTDDASSMGAALAFYTLFSIAPLLVMIIAVASLILGPDAAQEHILGQLRALTGAAGAQAVAELLKSANSPAKNALTALVGSVVLLLGATSVFTELYGNLNRIWRNPSAPKASGILHLLRTRILSFGMILGIGNALVLILNGEVIGEITRRFDRIAESLVGVSAHRQHLPGHNWPRHRWRWAIRVDIAIKT